MMKNSKNKFNIIDSINFNTLGDLSFSKRLMAYSLYHYENNDLISDIYFQDKIYQNASLPIISKHKCYYLKNAIKKQAPKNIPYYLIEQYFIKRAIFANNKKVTKNDLDIFDYKVQDDNLLYKAYQYQDEIPYQDYQNQPLIYDSSSFYSDKEYGLKAHKNILFFFNDYQIKIEANIVDYLFVKDSYVLLYTNSNGFFVEQFNFQNQSILKIKIENYLPSFVSFSTIYYEKENSLIFTMNKTKDEYNDPKNLYFLKLEKGSLPTPLIQMKYLSSGLLEEGYNLPYKGIHSSTYLVYQDEIYFIASKNATNALYKIPFKKNSRPVLIDDSINYINLYLKENKLCALVSNHDFHSKLINLNDKKVILEPNPNLKKKEFAHFENINIQINNKHTLQAFYYEPKVKKDKMPLIVLIHGGPNGYFSSGFSYEAQLYASQGYAILLPNPRGGSGFGKSHGHMRYAFNHQALDDVENLTKYVLKKHPYLDQKKVAITGGSYGGYLSIYAATSSKLFKTAVCLRPLISFQMTGSCSSSAGTSPSNKDKPFDNYLKENILSSLSAYVEKIDIPIQIMHSKLDGNCLVEASIQLFNLLDFYKPKLAKRLCLYPYSNHGLLSYGPANEVKQAYQDILDWFNKYL